MKPLTKKKTAYFCTNCGAMHLRWQGQCKDCGEWNTLAEETIVDTRQKAPRKSQLQTTRLPEIGLEESQRINSTIEEYDRVLGGGAVPGSAILIGGEPGIGKSSLLLQAAGSYSRAGYDVLYVSGEESAVQIKQRAQRFNIAGDNITIATTTQLEEVLTLCEQPFAIIIIDSIQTIASQLFESPPGTVGQVRESASRLIERAKRSGQILLLVGHITKEGTVAGPKVLEHMVDAVLYFEGDRRHLFRLLRSQKNRFGPAGEIGVFEMTGGGLQEVANPSLAFLSGVGAEPVSGRVVSAAGEGSRSFLVEVEALVTTSPYGTPQRVAAGLDSRRLAIITAVLEKRGGITLGGNDVFVTIAGGFHLDDTALDLAFLLAAASSRLNVLIDQTMLVVGEIGLSGDIRAVARIDKRLREAAKLGLTKAIIPRGNTTGLTPPTELEIIPVSDIHAALEIIR